MYCFRLFVLLLASARLVGYESLPNSIASKAVYYVKTQQLDDFSCGYNALFNACNVDRSCGISNAFFDYELFAKISMAYAKSEGLNPKSSTSNENTDDLAFKHLEMKNVCNLGFKDNKIIPLLRLHARIMLTGGETKADKAKMFQREFERQREEFLGSIKKQLDLVGGLTRVMHFICTVQDGKTGHAILISLVQNSTGRGLYIFDNMNRRINENSEIMRYVHYLSIRFLVSPKGVFKGPQLPERWGTLPKARYHYYLN